jgi:hypothetical protein
LLDRRVAVGSRGIRVRRLGAIRAGEIKITRFSRNKAVRIGEMIETAAARLDACCRAPCACHPGHDNGSRRREGALHCFASVIAVDAIEGALLGLVDGRFFMRNGGKAVLHKDNTFAEKEIPAG